jgi:hypothetical protein
MSWEARILPLPKKFMRATAMGFCGGHAVGMVESSSGKSQACWWPDGQPELLSLGAYKELQVLSARGDSIAGSWVKGSSGASGAAVWRLRDGALAGADLHDKKFEKTWAECAEHGLVLGVGVHKGRSNARPPDSGLVWREDGSPQLVTASGDVCVKATDGTRLAGSADGRAALWPAVDGALVDLGPAGFTSSEIFAIDGEFQVGVAFKGIKARAGLWRSTAASFVDLTPADYEVGRAFHSSGGWQVGFVRRLDMTRNFSSNLLDEAALWRGSSDDWFNLNSVLPASSGLNASVARAIERAGGQVRICGAASRCEVSDAGTDRESHFVPEARAVIWTAA